MPARSLHTQSATERVYIDWPAAEAVAQEAAQIGARRVFLITSKTLAQSTDEVRRIRDALGPRCAGHYMGLPPHSSRGSVLEAAAHAREAGADLLVSVGGGTVTDAAKVVSLCLKHNLREHDDLEPFHIMVDAHGHVTRPQFEGPDVRIVAVPTTLSGAEFWWAGGVRDERTKRKQPYDHRLMIPLAVVLDPAITRHTPQWLWLSTGVRSVDHAIETLGSLQSNLFCDGLAEHALALLGEGLQRVKRDSADMAGRLQCLIGTWKSMLPIAAGVPMGLSHATGHALGGAYGMPHGYTSCIAAPAALAFNEPVNAQRQARISAALGAAGQPASAVVDRLIRDLGMPRQISEVVKEPIDPQRLIKAILGDLWVRSNPRPIAEGLALESFVRELL
ncbi:MAG: iron-containing alcohol dehydrogenase [Burkholderiaceae bacterium]|nr:iron-containing alcohol dehydrogenase [Burkholderiaceae bacterium]